MRVTTCKGCSPYWQQRLEGAVPVHILEWRQTRKACVGVQSVTQMTERVPVRVTARDTEARVKGGHTNTMIGFQPSSIAPESGLNNLLASEANSNRRTSFCCLSVCMHSRADRQGAFETCECQRPAKSRMICVMRLAACCSVASASGESIQPNFY